MSLGRRGGQQKQESIWIEAGTLAKPSGHPFYERLNGVLDKQGFDRFAEQACAAFYSKTGRRSLAPGVYFRCLLVGYFEGLDSERGIAWRVADSLALRSFLGYELSQNTPDHTTISRTRRLLDPRHHYRTKVRTDRGRWCLVLVIEGRKPKLRKLVSSRSAGQHLPTPQVDSATASVASNQRILTSCT